MPQKAEIVKSLVSLLQKELSDLEGVYLFGSRNTGESKVDSDWDFGYLSREGLLDERSWGIKTNVESLFDIQIDLVDLYKATTVLQIQVLKTGTLVWIGEHNKIKQFEYLTLSYYQKLNEERADILKDIKLRGNIYG